MELKTVEYFLCIHAHGFEEQKEFLQIAFMP